MPPSPYPQPTTYPASAVPTMAPGAEPLPVVVVGAGPVGMATALGLAQRGIPVTLLEAGDQVSYGSRAICISRHSLEVAERLGVAGPIEAVALPWIGGRSYFRQTEVLRFTMPMADHDVRPPMVNIGQCQLEQIIVERVLAEPLVRLLWRAEVTGCTPDPEGVTLEVASVDGPRSLRARWVVAADGGRSRIRELAGLTLEGTSYEGRYVIADIHWPADLPVERRVWFDPPSNPGSTVLMHQQPDDIWRVDYQLELDADVEAELRAERITERIDRHLRWLGNEIPWTLEWHGIYMAHARALENFVHGRLVFAGDAAHLVPIFGVRGLNSGLEDAETLAWMLAAVVDGRADPALLRAYAVERHSAWEQNVANAGKSTRFMTPGSDGFRMSREAILRLAAAYPAFGFLLNPRQSSATHAHTSPLTWHADAQARGTLPGDPVPDWSVGSGESATTLNRLRGNGFGLLAFGLDEAAYAAVTAAGDRLAAALAPEQCRIVLVNGTVTEVAVPEHGRLVDETLQRALGARDGEVFVVRPDGLLLARLSSTAELDRVAGSIGAGRAPEGGRMAPEWPDQTPPAERHLEHLWLTLSQAIDTAGPADREGMLARLVLLLGSLVPINRLSSAIGSAVELGRVEAHAGDGPGATHEGDGRGAAGADARGDAGDGEGDDDAGQ